MLRRSYTLHLVYRDGETIYNERIEFRAVDQADLFQLMTDHFDLNLSSEHITCDADPHSVDCAAEPVSFTDADGNDILDLFSQWQANTSV